MLSLPPSHASDRLNVILSQSLGLHLFDAVSPKPQVLAGALDGGEEDSVSDMLGRC